MSLVYQCEKMDDERASKFWRKQAQTSSLIELDGLITYPARRSETFSLIETSHKHGENRGT